VTALLAHLESRRRAGGKLLVPYLMAGAPDTETFRRALQEVSPLGDAVEVGLPFSDPLMDGPVIASAGERALRDGVGPEVALRLIEDMPTSPTPRVVMTYYNPIHRVGEQEFCRRARRAGVSGLIVPDLPLEESEGLRAAAAEHDLGWVPLVAPTSSPERVRDLVATCTGFVYAISSLGVTGVRSSLSERVARVTEMCRAATDLPVLVGIGISSAPQAVEASKVSDGVVVGSAVVAALMEKGVGAAVDLLSGVRTALDGAVSTSP
jgi:tryptophan synthase alpha chain